MKKYLYLLAGLAAGFVLVFMGTAICQYLHLTQSGYVRYDDSVEVVYQQVAEYAGVDPATLSIHAKRQVGDDIFVLWKTPDRTEVSMTQLRQASFGAKLNAGEKLSYGFLNRDFLFYGFSGFLGVLIVLSGTGNKLLENAILQFKAHCPIIIDFRS